MSERHNYSMDQISESQYVLGIRKQDKYKVVDVILPDDWYFPDSLFPEKTNIFINQGQSAGHYSLFSEAEAFSDIYGLLLETVKFNQEAEEKLVILNKLQVKLQEYFDKLPLSKFKNLTFIVSGDLETDGGEPRAKITEILKADRTNGTVFKP